MRATTGGKGKQPRPVHVKALLQADKVVQRQREREKKLAARETPEQRYARLNRQKIQGKYRGMGPGHPAKHTRLEQIPGVLQHALESNPIVLLGGVAHPIRRAQHPGGQMMFPGFGRNPVGLLRKVPEAFRGVPKPRAVPKLPANMPPEVQASARKITAGLSFGGAKKAREAQAVLYREERARRGEAAHEAMKQAPGVKGFYAAKHELRGALPRVQFDALKGKFGDKEVQDLFTYVSHHEKLRPYEKVSTHRALVKAFGGEVPTNYERKLLHKAFGPEFVKAVQGSLPFMARLKKLGLDVANIPRSLMASFDMSAPFRQGLVAGARHPVIFGRNLPLM